MSAEAAPPARGPDSGVVSGAEEEEEEEAGQLEHKSKEKLGEQGRFEA